MYIQYIEILVLFMSEIYLKDKTKQIYYANRKTNKFVVLSFVRV